MKKGFSIVEMIIAITVLLILAVVITGSFLRFRDTQNLNSGIAEIASLINEGRSQTIASKNSSQYGIHFEATKAVLFAGTSYSPAGSDNKELKVCPLLEIYSISLNGGGSDVIFQQLTGKTQQYGVIGLRLKKDAAKTKNISISDTGIVAIQ